MKLHLPTSLRKALLLGFGAITVFSTSAQAEIMHNSATLLTYTDLASNMGRYSIYEQNALLKHMNKDGVFITFTQGEEPYKLDHGIISFESAVDGGPFTAIGYNVTATVQHNGVPNPVFTGRFLGSGNSVQYAGIEYRSCTNNTFLLTPQTDYKVTRLSKVITDITPSTLFDTQAYVAGGGQVKGMLQYHMGGGYQQRADADGNTTWLREAYVYVTAGIVQVTGYSRDAAEGTVDGRGIGDDSYTVSMTGVIGGNQWGPGTAGTPTHPLPYVTQGGDSGSPVWVWNEASGQYELIACHSARGGNNSYARGASDWTMDTLESFCKEVGMGADTAVVHIGAVTHEDSKTISAIANGSQEVFTTPTRGYVTTESSEGGTKITDFVGVRSGINTWNNLAALKDGQIPDGQGGTKNVNWYAYGNEYLNSTYNEGGDLQYADLFMTENLVFSSAESANSVVLDADVDLGIGYAQFSALAGSTGVSYTIQGNEGNNTLQFNHAGYIVDKGVDVHVKLVNDETDYFREWRKVGEGNLYLEGQGNNQIFLNVGGTGTTFLRENEGYAAYNVLINNGASVNLGGDVSQIKRDVTFGYGGGTLDFAGNVNMEWNNTNTADADGFTIHALTQDAIIANSTGNTTLTYTEGGDTNFQGSFRDTENSSLNVIYAGDGTWTLNSIHTDLKSGGFTVANGSVILAGTLTEHAQGSLNGFNQQRYSNADDWHYADAAMNVTVGSGATFELGSHARLTGDVTVNGSGTFLMREGVRHQKEYIEGWYELEDTYAIREFYGLHGNVNLNDAGSKMVVKFSDGTDANTTVAGNITGEGSMTVDTAGGSLTLSGQNSFSGEKSVVNGLLVLSNAGAAGSTVTNQWKLQDKAQLAVKNTSAAEALALVDKSSSGVLVLTQDESGSAIDMTGYNSLIIGAENGRDIQFGAENSEYALAAVDGKWNLGGGGGNLVVNYRLQEENATLVLGNQYTTGSVTLTNTGNDIGAIDFAGKVTLSYTDSDALGGADINLSYTNRIMGAGDTVSLIDEESDGVMLLDNMANQNVSLSGRTSLHLGSAGNVVYTGDITLDEGAAGYYFGGITGTLVLDNALTDQNEVYTNLVLDGQTYSGGVLELKHALEITGSVKVYGHSPYSSKGWTGGNATLRLCEDNSMENPYLVTLYEGGILDINGTEQSFTSIDAEAGSKIIDSKGDGVLRINSDGDGFSFLELAGEVEVGTIDIYSASILGGTTPLSVSLGGKMTYTTMNVSGSSGVAIVESDVLCATGKTILDTTTLYMGTHSATTQLELNNSTVHLGENSDKTASAELFGAVSTGEGTENTVIFNSSHTKVHSVVDVAKDSKLTIIAKEDDNGAEVTAKFGSASFAESGGTVVMQAAQVNLENSTGTHFGGTLEIQGKNKTMTLKSNGGSDNILREIDKLKVQAGTTLTLQEESWNTIWNIHELTGEGNVTWNSKATHWYSSRVLLGSAANSEEGGTFKPDEDMGKYSGVFTVQRTNVGAAEKRAYASYVELAHDTIMQGAKVDLQGCENGYVSLAVNTDNGTIQGLNGNGYSVLYAGAAVEGGDKEDNQLQYAPVSMRKANLVIKGGGESNFAGSVQAGEEGAGLSIVVDGQGTQNFSGADVNLLNVTVSKGTLGFTHATETPDIAGQISIAQGATLDLDGKELTLKEGNVLAVQRAEGSNASASLDGSLLFSGGSLLFSGDAVVKATGGALNLTGSAQVAQGSALTINFSEELSMHAGDTYTLSTGNWSAVSQGDIVSGDLIYYSAVFSTDASGLKVTLSNRTDMQVWNGTEQNRIWDGSKFGNQGNLLDAQKIAVFNDTAQSTAVSIDGTVAAKQLLFDNNSKNYTLASTSGNGVTAASLRQVGTAATTLGNGVTVTGEASVEAGTLVLESGSSVGSAAVAEGAVLKLAGVPANVPTSIAGDGSLVVDLEQETASLGSTDIAQILIQSGTLKVDAQPLGVKESLLVAQGGTLHADSTTFLADASKELPIQLAGTLQLEIGSNQDFTYTVASPVDAEGSPLKGRIVKTGAGTMTLKGSVSADTVTVSQGSLTVSDDAVVPDFLGRVNTLEVTSGASASIGCGNFTVNGDNFGTSFSVAGAGSNLELSLSQYGVKTIKGDISVTNGGKLSKYDGGLILAGTTKLGSSASDEVTLLVSWGKAGWNFTGKVEGAGKVNLSSLGWGGAADTCILSNDSNTFDGQFAVHSKMRLVAGSDNALATADVSLDDGAGLMVAAENAHIRNLTGVAGSILQLNGDKDRTAGTLTVNQTQDSAFAGTISSNVALVKEGGATLTLSGNNTHTGGTTVNAGKLVATSGSALGSGPVTLTDGILDLTAQVTTGALTMNGGTLVLGGQNWISSAGAVSLNGSVLDLSRFAVTAGNNYTLATGTSVTVGENVTFTLANQDLRDQFKLVSMDNSLVLFYGQPSPVSDLIWDNKSGNGLWDIQNSWNWHVLDQSEGSSRFAATSNATFNAAANNQTVTLVQDITAGTVTLEGATHVTISGSHKLTAGRLTGEGTVTVGESATLTFNGGASQDHPHAVDGTVSLEIAAGGTVNVNGGTDNVLQKVSLQEGGALNLGAGSSTSIAGTLALNGTLTNNGTLTIGSGSVSQGASGTITGSGQTTLNGTITNAGTLVLDNANLKGAGDSAAITGNVVINGGTLGGTMTLGSVDSTVTVTKEFTMAAGASYTVEGHLVLDALDSSWMVMEGAERDTVNNGFISAVFVTIYNTESDDVQLALSEGAAVTYRGLAGEIWGAEFLNSGPDYTAFHVNVATDEPERLSHALDVSTGQGKQLNKVHMVANGSKLAVDATVSLPDLTVASGEGAANLLSGEAGAHTLTVAKLLLDGKLNVGEDVTLKLDTQLSGTTPDLANLANAGGTVSVALGGGDNVLTMDAGSTGSLELRSGYISYRSELGNQTLHLADGTQLWFGEPAGAKDEALFTNDIVLDGNATVRVYGSTKHASATIGGNVTGTGYTLTKTDGDQNLTFSGVVNVGGLTTADNGNGTIVFNGGEGSIGDIVTNGATKIRYSASTTHGAKNTYSFDTFNIAPSNGERWLIVDENVTVHGTGSDLGNDNIPTINGGWNLNGGGLEVNGTLDLAGVISFDGPGNSSIKGAGIINTTGLNISNSTNTTVQGGVTINITSNTGVKKRAGDDSTLNLADATLTATTVDWELQNSVNSVNLTNASDGTTFEAAQGRTITLTKQMDGSGKLVKAGEGTMLVKGANTYSGGTSIDAGTVTTSHATALGTGNVTVAANAVLQVNDNLTIKGDNTAKNNGLNNLGSVSIEEGRTLSLYALTANKQYNLGMVNLAGATAAIENTNHCGTLSLDGVSGAEDSTLVLFSNHSSNTAYWNLGSEDSGSFAGNAVVLKVGDGTNTSGNRTVNYNFNNRNMFSGAEVRLENASVTQGAKTMTNNLVLNSAEVHMGGINDAAADTVTDTRKWSVSKGDAVGERAKLVLDGNAESGYSSAVKIGAAIDIKKTGTATQAFTGDTSGFNGSVDVEGGILNIMNAASVDVKDVTIGANATLGVYNGTTATADTDYEGTLTIKNAQSLTAKGAGATLNANVVMETGSTLDVSATGGAGLMLGSTLTLNTGMDLSEADYANVGKLLAGETYVLFEGVDTLKLGETSYTQIAPVQVDAADYYKGLESGSYYLVYNYNGSNVGQVALFSVVVPEPATSTLSLLALAALCMRRRRK